MTAKPEREFKRREVDQGTAAVAAVAVKTTSKTFWEWVDARHIDALAVIVVTLYLTIGVLTWATDFADAHFDAGAQVAAIIGSVLGPWLLMQGALTKWYLDLKGKNGDNK